MRPLCYLSRSFSTNYGQNHPVNRIAQKKTITVFGTIQYSLLGVRQMQTADLQNGTQVNLAKLISLGLA